MTPLKTAEGCDLFSSLHAPLKACLQLVDVEVGISKSSEIEKLLSELSDSKTLHELSEEAVLNDIFVLERYVLLIGEYALLWRQIASSKFSESWITLQNAFDLIRLIRRFSNIDTSAIEDQLYALETLYPYKVFFSMGAVVEWFECSICGKDIDSFDCNHRKGELYLGRIAYATARNIVQLDHIAIVDQPADKRCVISFSNEDNCFSAVRYLGELISSKKLLISCFGGVAWGKRRLQNPEYKVLRRNELCYCQSGIKFKKCCINKAFTEQDHAQILPRMSIIPRIIA
ncbi:SEC-C metal-binding domain-containing protein [Pseudomonas neuropathica]|jgi:hypothetical protein